MLIHCGDMFNMFDHSDDGFEKMDEWFAEQDFKLILCIGGNHDFELQRRASYVDQPFKNAVYLEDSGYEFEGVHFFGAPWVPELHGQAYFIKAERLAEKWASIPQSVDVLITHSPPAGILDVSSKGFGYGCRYLFNDLARTKPTIHCFGHVHNSSGIYKNNKTTYINAALANTQHQLCHSPYEIELIK